MQSKAGIRMEWGEVEKGGRVESERCKGEEDEGDPVKKEEEVLQRLHRRFYRGYRGGSTEATEEVLQRL